MKSNRVRAIDRPVHLKTVRGSMESEMYWLFMIMNRRIYHFRQPFRISVKVEGKNGKAW